MSSTLDTRDLQERLEELQSLKDTFDTAQAELDELMTSDLAAAEPDFDEKVAEARSALDEATEAFGDEEHTELEELASLSEEVSEWSRGNQLIPEEDFEDYCRELCEDIGDVPRNFPSYIVIDWEATARNLRIDYSDCEYQGTTYLYR
jgi:antirestriction protein